MREDALLDAEARLREEFNRWAAAGRGEAMEEEHATIAAGMLQRMSFTEHEKLLDIGCGTGWFSALLASKVPGGQVVGIDVADDMIRRARAKYVNLTNVLFVVAPAEEIPWDDDFFNQVISIESAYYWPDPPHAFHEIFRVLRPGGRVSVLMNLYEENVDSHPWQQRLDVPTHLLSAEKWCGLLAVAGFESARHSRVPDPRPVPDDHQSMWFSSLAAQRRFRSAGALLVHGRKPEF